MRDDDSVFASIQGVAGVRYNRATFNRDIVDTYILRKARQKGVRLPTGGPPEEYKYLGAFVFPSVAGMSENVVYCDISCFTGDHDVVTPDGIRNIKEIEEGDSIYTLNDETFEVEEDVVAKTHEYPNKYGEVHKFDNTTCDLAVTENHRFLTARQPTVGGRHKPNKELNPSDYEWGEFRDLERGRHVFPIASPMENTEYHEYISLLDLVEDEYVAVYYDGRIPRWDGFPDDLAEAVETVYGTAEDIGYEEKVGKHLIPVGVYQDYRNFIDNLASEVWLVGGSAYHTENGRVGNHCPLEVHIGDFAELIAWYVSEGHVGSHNPHRVCIAQEDTKNLWRIERLVEKLGFHPTASDRKVSFTCSVVARLLQALCGEKSESKRLPEIIFEWPSSIREFILSVMVDGDGSKKNPNSRYYWTKSDELKEDVVRLCASLGHTPSVKKRDVWRVQYGTDGSFQREDWEAKKHNGKVYCVTGEKNSAILAGRNQNFQWVGNSMYPNLVVTLNLSPDTVIGTEEDLRESQYSVKETVWGYIDPRPVKHLENGQNWQQYKDQNYKMIYDPEASSVKWTCDEDDGPQYEKLYVKAHNVETGFLTECVDELIELKNKYRGQDLYGAIKRVCNSIYGVTGFANDSSSFRLYDWRIAEAITLSGRKMIQRTADYVVDHARENGFDDAYVVMGDTDGFGVSYVGASTRHEALTTAAEAVANLNDTVYDQMMEELFGVVPENHNAAIDVEAYSPRVFVPSDNPPNGDEGVSKRYVKWSTWEN